MITLFRSGTYVAHPIPLFIPSLLLSTSLIHLIPQPPRKGNSNPIRDPSTRHQPRHIRASLQNPHNHLATQAISGSTHPFHNNPTSTILYSFPRWYNSRLLCIRPSLHLNKPTNSNLRLRARHARFRKTAHPGTRTRTARVSSRI